VGDGDATQPEPGAGEDGDSPSAQTTRGGQSPQPESPLPYGAGEGFTDLRYPIRTLGRVVQQGPITLEEVEAMLATCDCFLAQVVIVTSRVLETVPMGEVRQLVAGEMAMSGAVVKQDGTVLKREDMPPAPAEPTKRPRGTSHPLLTLVRLAIQAVRLLRQITFGTHPEATRKRNEMPEHEESFEQTMRKMGSYFSAVT
jgi:hypothetical protein